MKHIKLSAIAGFTRVFSPPSYACAVASPPFDPARANYDVVLIGKVTNDVATSGFALATLRVQQVVSGQFPYPTYPLNYHVYDGRGMCSPPGPYLKKGQTVTVYLSKPKPTSMTSKAAPNARFYPQGWQIRSVRK